MTGIFTPQCRNNSVDPWACLRFVRDSTGKGILSQIIEILRLRLGRGRIGVHEYFRYGLFDDQTYDFRRKSQFIGWRRMQHIHDTYIAPEWLGIAHDTLAANSLLSALGLRQPKLYGIYHPSRAFGSLPALRGAADLRHFLRQVIEYPFFSKPDWGEKSIGAANVESLERDRDELVFANQDRLPVDSFVDQIVAQRGVSAGGRACDMGYLFMERLCSHPEIAEICGSTLSTLRIVVLATLKGPEIFRAIWKIPTQGNPADNFWRQGNMIAPVDLESGRVGEVIGEQGPRRSVVTRHPQSQKPLTDIVLPDWPQARDACLTAAAALPGLRLQGWDVALTSEGPVVLEVNPVGDVRLPQLASREGFCNERMCRFLAEIGIAA